MTLFPVLTKGFINKYPIEVNYIILPHFYDEGDIAKIPHNLFQGKPS